MTHVRRAIDLDAPSMARLLNEIIDQSGPSAVTRPVTARYLADWMHSDRERSAWHVALDDRETVIGFQVIGPRCDLPPEATDIATFVRSGQTGLGIGSALFKATTRAAKEMGYAWINATIRADNGGALTYYQSRGFRDWHIDEDVCRFDGLTMDRISKRYDL